MKIKTLLVDNNDTLSSFLIESPDIDFVGYKSNFNEINPDNLDLIIFDISKDNQDEVISHVKNIKTKNENVKFIALSSDMDSSLISKTKEIASDFLIKPVIPVILGASIKKLDFCEAKESNSKKSPRIISIFSLKGGVGKTSVAINLAYNFSNLNSDKKICLIDFNMNSSDCSIFLNVANNTSVDNILSKIQNLSKDAILSMISKYNETNLYVLPVFDENSFNKKINPLQITTLISFLKNVFDYIIIDMPGIIDENNVAIMACCDIVIYLSLLNKAVLKSTQEVMEAFLKIGFDSNKIKLVINRFVNEDNISIEDFEREVNKEVFFKVPNNYLTMSDAISQTAPLEITNPQSNIAKALKTLTENIFDLQLSKDSIIKGYNHGIYNVVNKMGE